MRAFGTGLLSAEDTCSAKGKIRFRHLNTRPAPETARTGSFSDRLTILMVKPPEWSNSLAQNPQNAIAFVGQLCYTKAAEPGRPLQGKAHALPTGKKEQLIKSEEIAV